MELEAAIGPLYNITIGYSTIKGASKYLWILIGVGIDFVWGIGVGIGVGIGGDMILRF